MAAALGLVAGDGALPRLIAEDRGARGLPTLVVRFEGVTIDWPERTAGVTVADLPFEKPGRLFSALRAAGADAVCFAGGMRRPARIDPLRFDLTAVRLAAKVLPALRLGDDGMLRALASVIEGEGFRMIAAQDLLDGLLAPAGRLGRRDPTEDERADAARAAGIVAALGAADVGQAAVVHAGVCLGVEAIGGTDVLLDQVAALPVAVRPAPGGVLLKAPKPGQDRRMDLPAVGPETMRRAAAAGLTAVRLTAGGVLVLGREETAAEADRHDLALWAEAAPALARGP